MSKKSLNVQSIQSELEGGASLFFRSTPPLNRVDHELKNERTTERSNVQANERTKGQHEERLPRRVIRHTFDVYHDQLINLQRLQIEVMTKGRRKPKLGKMVQKALDAFIAREMKKLKGNSG